MQVKADGRWHAAGSLDGLDVAWLAHRGVLWFEGTEIFLQQAPQGGKDSRHDLGEMTARYEAQLLANGNVRIVAIEEGCWVRDQIWAAEWDPVS